MSRVDGLALPWFAVVPLQTHNDQALASSLDSMANTIDMCASVINKKSERHVLDLGTEALRQLVKCSGKAEVSSFVQTNERQQMEELNKHSDFSECKQQWALDASNRGLKRVLWPSASLFPQLPTLQSALVGTAKTINLVESMRAQETNSHSAFLDTKNGRLPPATSTSVHGSVGLKGIAGFATSRLSLRFLVELDVSSNVLFELCATVVWCAALPMLRRLYASKNNLLNTQLVEQASALLSQFDEAQSNAAHLRMRLPWLFALPRTLCELDMSSNSRSSLSSHDSTRRDASAKAEEATGSPRICSESNMSHMSTGILPGKEQQLSSERVFAYEHSSFDLFSSWRSFRDAFGACNLKVLDMSYNCIFSENLSFGIFAVRGALTSSKLQSLSLRGCQLNSDALDVLLLSGDACEGAQLSGLRNLHSLDISDNLLLRLPAASFWLAVDDSLSVLRAGKNNIGLSSIRSLRDDLLSSGHRPGMKYAQLQTLEMDDDLAYEAAAAFLKENEQPAAFDHSVQVYSSAASLSLASVVETVSADEHSPRRRRRRRQLHHFTPEKEHTGSCALGFDSSFGDSASDAGYLDASIAALEHSIDLDDEMASRRVHDFFSPTGLQMPQHEHSASQNTPGAYFAARSAVLGQLEGSIIGDDSQRPDWTADERYPFSTTQQDDLALYSLPKLQALSIATRIADRGAILLTSPSSNSAKKRSRFSTLSRLRERRIQREIATPENWIVKDHEQFCSGGSQSSSAMASPVFFDSQRFSFGAVSPLQSGEYDPSFPLLDSLSEDEEP